MSIDSESWVWIILIIGGLITIIIEIADMLPSQTSKEFKKAFNYKDKD